MKVIDRGLRWSPPRQERPLIVDVGLGYFASQAYKSDQDVIFVLPSSPRRPGADLQINGGRHVRIVGGHCQGRLSWHDGFGSLYVEGLIIDLTAAPNRDAINVSGADGATPDVYLQKILVTGVQGTFSGIHADVFQPWGPIGHLRVHAFTGDTNYQGFFIRPENSVASATFSCVNMRFNSLGRPEGNTFLYWCRNLNGSPARGDPFFPVEYGREVYGEANSRTPSVAAAFPPPGFFLAGRGGQVVGGIAGDDGSIQWPEASGIKGTVLRGIPPDGDFVNRTDVGAGYRSAD